MAENSKIEWTHHTFNPWIGCQKVGPGCDHCYAEAMMDARLGRVDWGPHASRSRTSASYWRQPLKWDRDAAAAGERRRVFCASLADVFDNHGSITSGWRGDLWHLIARTPNLDWMLLTKRPANIMSMLPDSYGAPAWGTGWPNVWLGCTVVNQAEADREIPKLLALPAARHFLSMEPLLGPVDLAWSFPDTRTACCHRCGFRTNAIGGFCPNDGSALRGDVGVDLVIVGGESGPRARPMHPGWVRSLRGQCSAAGVPFFFKQWGEWAPSTPEEAAGNPRSGWLCLAGHPHVPSAAELYPEAGAAFVAHKGKKAAGRLLDGETWDQMPEPRDA